MRSNPSLKRSANGRPPGPVWRYTVHFRQPGPWRPAVVARLARTLGSTKTSRAAPQQKVRLSAWTEQPRLGEAAGRQDPSSTSATTDGLRTESDRGQSVPSRGPPGTESKRALGVPSTRRKSRCRRATLGIWSAWEALDFNQFIGPPGSARPSLPPAGGAAAQKRGVPRSAARSGRLQRRATRNYRALEGPPPVAIPRSAA